jgi:single-stranded-DNA-specific exonuclease
VHVLCDFDGDGLSAGALLVRSLRAAGYSDVAAECRRKGESAWGAEIGGRLRDRAASHGIDALIVADMGSRDGVILRNAVGQPVPLLLIDHHRPTGQPQGSTLISSYGGGSPSVDGKDIATSGLLSWWSARALAGEAAEEWLWLAAISILSDLGDRAPFPELTAAKARFGTRALREATSLVNAPRRASAGRADAALALLIEAGGPERVIDGSQPQTAALRKAKLEVDHELAAARKQPPRFSTALRSELGADLVAIRLHSPCQVHPLIAQQWRGRFAKNVVFGVNTGYRPGWVHFSARAPAGVNLIEFLAQHRPQDADDSYGMGHDQASGGALPVPVWNRWIQEMGFGDDMRVLEG